MTFRARFYDNNGNVVQDVLPFSGKIEYSLDKTPSWEIGCLTSIFETEDVYVVGTRVDLLYQGQVLLRGTIYKVSFEFQDQSSLKLSGRHIIDRLYSLSSLYLGFFRDSSFLSGLNQLILDTDWSLGDVSGMTDPLQTVYVDTRDQKNRLSQITKYLDTLPDVFFLPGDNTIDLFDVGYTAGPLLTPQQGDYGAITNISIESTRDDYLSYMIFHGEDVVSSGTRRKLIPSDAFLSSPNDFVTDLDYVHHPDFPLRDLGGHFALFSAQEDLPTTHIRWLEREATTDLDVGVIGQKGGFVRSVRLDFVAPAGQLEDIFLTWKPGGDVFSLSWEIVEIDANALTETSLSSGTFQSDTSRIQPGVEIRWGYYYRLIISDNASVPDDTYATLLANEGNTDFGQILYRELTPFTDKSLVATLRVASTLSGFQGESVKIDVGPPPTSGGEDHTTSEIETAGQALIVKARNELRRRLSQEKSLSVDLLIAEDVYPILGQNVSLYAQQVHSYQIFGIHQSFNRQVSRVVGSFTVLEQSFSFDDTGSVSSEIKIVSDGSTSLENNDPLIELLALTDEQDTPSREQPLPPNWETGIIVEETLNIPAATASNYTTLSGKRVYRASFSPTGQSAYFWGRLAALPLSESADVSVIQRPTELQNGVFELSFKDRDWTAEDSEVLTVYMFWSK